MSRPHPQKPHPEKRRNPLPWFLVVSLLLHGLFALWWTRMPPRDHATPAETLPPVKLRFSQPPPAPADTPRQIVDTSQKQASPVQPTELLAEHDTRAEKETIAEELGKAENAQPLDTPQQQAQQRRESERGRQPLQQLVPRIQDLVAGNTSRQSNYIQRERGPVTLLNAHGTPWAPYMVDAGHRTVRFLNMNAGLMSWYLQDVARLSFPAQVKLHVNRAGSVVKSTLTRSSGSSKVDAWFLEAMRSGFTGPQPPTDMLQDTREFTIVGQLFADHIAVGLP